LAAGDNVLGVFCIDLIFSRMGRKVIAIAP